MELKKDGLDIVIVTFNRVKELKKTLLCYDKQTQSFNNIIVVNNCSNDGTKEYLESWKNEPSCYSKHVLNLNQNTGGAGGFYAGQEYALKLESAWVLLADDDAYPEPTLVEEFWKFEERNNEKDTVAVCAAVINNDDSICIYHRRRVDKKYGLIYNTASISENEYNKECFEADILSYVGAIISKDAIRKVGLVNKEYFIYSDDAEHSLRLRKIGKILIVPSLRIHHDDTATTVKNDGSVIATWRDYYSNRNFFNLLLKNKHFLSFVTYAIIQLSRKTVISNKIYLSLTLTAIRDAMSNRLGKHDIYKPGWNLKKK